MKTIICVAFSFYGIIYEKIPEYRYTIIYLQKIFFFSLNFLFSFIALFKITNYTVYRRMIFVNFYSLFARTCVGVYVPS